MLDSLRQSAGSWVVKIFLGLLVLSFAAWGIGDIFRISPESSVASVGDREISGSELVAAYQRDLRVMQNRLGQSISREEAQSLGLIDRSLDAIVNRALFDQAASELSLTASPQAVSETIRNDPAFRNRLGEFDPFLFEQATRNAGFDQQTYLQVARLDNMRAQLLGSVAAPVRPPVALSQPIQRHANEKRVLEVLTVPNERLAGLPEPTEADIESFYREHEERYMAPEYRSLTFMTLSPDHLTEQVVVGEDEIREAYRYRSAEFTVPERREVQQMVFDDEAAARKAAEQLAAGEDFVAVAKAEADMAEADVKLGRLSQSELPFAGDTVFALSDGEVSTPVETPLGWRIFRVTEIIEGSKVPFEEARKDIEADLRLDRATDLMFETANRIEDALAGGAGPAEIAGQFGLDLVRVDAVDASGLDRAGNPVMDLPQAPAFLRTAFERGVGEELTLTETQGGGYFLVQVDQVVEPALRPLDEVREQVVEAWRQAKRREMAEAKAQSFVDRVKGGDSLVTVGVELGIDPITTSPLARGELGGRDFSSELARAVFDADSGDVLLGDNRLGDAQVITRVVEVQQPPPDAEAGEGLRPQLAAQMAQDLVQQYRGALERRHPIDIDQDAIAGLFDTFVQR